MKQKFDTRFNNVIEAKDLRGDYTINHGKQYVKRMPTENDNGIFTDLIHEDNNNLRNKKRYNSANDLITLEAFEIKYELQ